MIPLSVRMKGWMRYRDEEVADFNGGSLIAIIGVNGAGKSSIFDAITYALYGVHRLGKMHASELISEDLDRLSVDFEFEAEDQRYLVRRSREKESERDQSLWIWDDDGNAGVGDWTQVPGTEKEDALRRSLDHIVRLSPEAFTSSFMLQQGSATAFLDADPKPRFDIISSLIGLREYEWLEKRAREAQKVEKTRLDDLTLKLKEFEGVDESSIAALRVEVADAAEREVTTSAALVAATAMLADARRHAALVDEIAVLDGQISTAEVLIADRETIEQNATMHAEFAIAIERLASVRTALDDAARARTAADAALRDAAVIDVVALTKAQDTAAIALQSAETAGAAVEATHATAQRAEREAYDFATAALSIIAGRARIAEIDARVAQYKVQHVELEKAQSAAEKQIAVAKKALTAAEATVDAARTAAAESRASVGTIKQQLDGRKAAAKEATCSHCGQPIDKKVAKQQIDELSALLVDVSAAATTAANAEKVAARALVDARKQHDDIAAAAAKDAQRLHRLEGELATATSEYERAVTDVKAIEAAAGKRLAAIEKAKPAHEAAKRALDVAAEALKVARAGVEAARHAAERARAAANDGQRQRTALEAAAREQQAKADGHRSQAEAFAAGGLGALAAEALADPDGVLAIVRSQQQDLTDAPARKVALDEAVRDHTVWSAQRDVKRADVDAIPDAHRIDAAEAASVASAAGAAAREAKDAVQSTQHALTMLEARIDEIARTKVDRDRADGRRKLFQKLVKLLGKNGLQGALVTDALATITNHANAFLQRLTGGSLQLTIHRGEGDALELQALDSTCMREPRSVKALSGSQKFRCAVAIASGIGQYAGAGGMRSIVIDEGFGSLDQAGQRLMVEELQQLATHMDKVIVVSHLEAFTDQANFPDRILVETRGNGSHITKLF